jgi:tetratricopeptide (TPR) repeat protein
MAALTAAFAFTIGIGSTWLYLQNRKLNTALQETKSARDRADERVEFLLGDFADDLENIGRLSLVEKAWTDLEKAYQQDPSMSASPEGKLRHARLLTRWSKLLLKTKPDEALSKAQQARDIQKTGTLLISSTILRDSELETGLAEATAQASLGHFTEALACLDELAKPYQTQTGRALRYLAQIESSRSGIYLQISADRKLGEASVPAAQRAVAAARAWLTTTATNQARELLAECLQRLATAKLQLAGLADHHEPFEGSQILNAQAIIADFTVMKEAAESIEIGYGAESHYLITWARYHIAYLLHRLPGNHDSQVEEMKQILQLTRDKYARDPQNLYWAVELCNVVGESAHLNHVLKNSAEELINRKAASDLADNITRQTPLIRQWMLMAMRNHLALAKVYLEVERADDASAASHRAVEVTRDFLAKNPKSELDQNEFYNLVRAVGKTLEQSNRLDDALSLFQENLRFTEQQISKDASVCWPRLAGGLHRRIADIYTTQHNLPAAMDANQSALRYRVALLRQRSETTKTAGDVWHAYQEMVKSQIQQNLLSEGLETAAAAVRLWKEMGDLPGDRAVWGNSAQWVCERILNSNQQSPRLETQARELAAETLDILYGRQPPESDADRKLFPNLQAMVAPLKP